VSKIRIGPLSVDDLDFDAALTQILDLASAAGPRTWVVTPNIQHLSLLRRDRYFAKAYRNAALVLPDGWPIVVAMRLRGARATGRVTGADLFPALCVAAARRGIGVAIIGGREDSAAEAGRRLGARIPGLRVVLTDPAPPGFDSNADATEALCARIAESAAGLVFYGVGAPKQEMFAATTSTATGSGVAVCVGAAIDFVAGVQHRAPEFWQRHGVEWLYRIMMEPRRLLTRYLWALPDMLLIWAAALRHRAPRTDPGGPSTGLSRPNS
jgi:N-acetylglucosaminyldiphosphoundecaprenol N-acetyl-beta-D-mannosaminyltransferase